MYFNAARIILQGKSLCLPILLQQLICSYMAQKKGQGYGKM